VKALLTAAILVAASSVGVADPPSVEGKSFTVKVAYTNNQLWQTSVWSFHGHQLDVRWKSGATERLDLTTSVHDDAVAFTATRSTDTPPKGERHAIDGTFDVSGLHGTLRISDNKTMITSHFVFVGTPVDTNAQP
jgi:hypothetical protein